MEGEKESGCAEKRGFAMDDAKGAMEARVRTRREESIVVFIG